MCAEKLKTRNEEARVPLSDPIDPAWAWAPYEPDAARPWNLRWAGHLYRRAGFGGSWSQLQEALGDGPQKAVEKLLRPRADVAAFNRVYDGHETASIDPGSGSAEGLCQWWLRRMIATPHPLLEKMTLFWHGYFGTSNVRVGHGVLVQRYVHLLRKHALGRFAPLVREIARDPATLLSLGADANRKARPNDRVARALLEEYTLGPGTYSEQDVRETARAMTGWFVLRGRLRFIPREHDASAKKILGREGPWKDEDAVRIALEQPAAPRRVVRKLYRFLVSETDEPGDALVAPLAESLAKDYDVARLVETVLRSNLFFSPAAYRQRVKSPVEFALGSVRAFEEILPTAPLDRDLADLGQQLAHPPTVQGWPGGRAWINNFTLPRRSNLAWSMLAEAGPYAGKLDPAAVARKHGASSPEAASRLLVDLLLQGDVEPGTAQGVLSRSAGSDAAGGLPRRLRRLAHSIVNLPEFHLA